MLAEYNKHFRVRGENDLIPEVTDWSYYFFATAIIKVDDDNISILNRRKVVKKKVNTPTYEECQKSTIGGENRIGGADAGCEAEGAEGVKSINRPKPDGPVLGTCYDLRATGVELERIDIVCMHPRLDAEERALIGTGGNGGLGCRAGLPVGSSVVAASIRKPTLKHDEFVDRHGP